MYLNDGLEGAETFPESGFAAAPRLYFEYCNDGERQLDPASQHAGAAPLSGEKWIVTKWMRQRRFVPA